MSAKRKAGQTSTHANKKQKDNATSVQPCSGCKQNSTVRKCDAKDCKSVLCVSCRFTCETETCTAATCAWCAYTCTRCKASACKQHRHSGELCNSLSDEDEDGSADDDEDNCSKCTDSTENCSQITCGVSLCDDCSIFCGTCSDRFCADCTAPCETCRVDAVCNSCFDVTSERDRACDSCRNEAKSGTTAASVADKATTTAEEAYAAVVLARKNEAAAIATAATSAAAVAAAVAARIAAVAPFDEAESHARKAR
jgi:hypothetical protein